MLLYGGIFVYYRCLLTQESLLLLHIFTARFFLKIVLFKTYVFLDCMDENSQDLEQYTFFFF